VRIGAKGGRRRHASRVGRALAAVALLTGGLASGAAADPEAQDGGRFDTVVIDAGHGGDDHGARGPKGLLEKDLVLDVAKRVAAKLRAAGLRAILTREDDRFVGLDERTSIANDARADLFVSIHANASEARAAKGIETFFVSLDATDEAARALAAEENKSFASSGGPAALEGDPLFQILGDMIATEHLVESQDFARLALGELLSKKGAVSRGVKQAPFVVLMGVQMPASLVEIGFITNAREEGALATPAERERIAGNLADAALQFGRRFDAKRGVAPQGGR
jgi:N-acetylmuramoyl-L-alanine amidase